MGPFKDDISVVSEKRMVLKSVLLIDPSRFATTELCIDRIAARNDENAAS